ncbi:MAG TPA: hypothetical protein VGC21_05050, partial [Telluria sp.]
VAARLNDWVPQVRDAARRAILALLPRLSSHAIVALLPHIFALRRKGRTDHTQWLAHFERESLAIIHTADLIGAIRGRHVQLARAAYDLAARHGLLEADLLAQLALANRADIVTSVRAASAIRLLPSARQLPLYVHAMRSHFGPVRTIAIQGLLQHPDLKDKAAFAQTWLLDPQSSVRSVAIAFLLAAQFDARQYYRARLDDNGTAIAQLRISLTSLSSLHNAADADLARRFATHPRISVRQVACVAWLRLVPAEKDAVARAALADCSPRLNRTALDMVRRQGAYIAFADLRDDLLLRREWRLLLQFAESDPWNWLEAICWIAIVTGIDDAVRPLLTTSLRAWTKSNRAFTWPQPKQQGFITSEGACGIYRALEDSGASVMEQVQARLSMGTRR